MIWNNKAIGFAVAALLAGTSVQTAAAQGYSSDGYGQYGGYEGAYNDNTDYGYSDEYGYADSAAYGEYDSGAYGEPVSFDYFQDTLSPYGEWYHHPRWGHVWRPIHAGADFRPYYSQGHWSNTLEFGWTWVSDYEWGHIPFHYGRWVNDPYDGWLWLPGYVWSPSWVVWRSGGGYLGWFPMPPTNDFLIGFETYNNDWRDWDRGFGYADWYGADYGSSWISLQFVFVEENHFGHRDFHRWAAPRNRVGNFVYNTTNITNYVTVNNYIVNRSVERHRFARGDRDGNRDGNRDWGRPVRARDVLREAPVTQVETGRRIHERERRNSGGDVDASPRERIRALPEGRGRNLEARRERRLEETVTLPATENAAGNPEAGRARNPRPRQEPARVESQQPDRAVLQRQPQEERAARQQAERQNVERQNGERARNQQREQERAMMQRRQQEERAARQQVARQQAERQNAAQTAERARNQQREQERGMMQRQRQEQRAARRPVERQQAERQQAERQEARRQRNRQPQEAAARDEEERNGRPRRR